MKKYNFLKDSGHLSIKDIANSLIQNPERQSLDDFFTWPPDLFALTSSILSLTGCYRSVTVKSKSSILVWPPNYMNSLGVEWKSDLEADGKEWKELVKSLGQQWRMCFDETNENNPLYTNDVKHEYGVLNFNKLSYDQIEDVIERTINSIKPIEFSKLPLIDKLRKYFDLETINRSISSLNGFEEYLNFNSLPEDITENWELFKSIMTLHAICDEFSAGFCIRSNKTLRLEYYKNYNKDQYKHYLKVSERIAKSLLQHNNSISRINSERCNILPKRQTPHSGITLRSISGNIAYHRSSISVNWNFYSQKNNTLFNRLKNTTVDIDERKQKNVLESISILLIPFPWEIASSDFRPIETEYKVGRKHEYFHYKPTQIFKDEHEDDNYDEMEFRKYLESFISKGISENQKIDIIVLPETALNISLLKVLVALCLKFEIPGFVTGMREEYTIENDSYFGANYVFTNFFNYSDSLIIELKKQIEQSWQRNKKDFVIDDSKFSILIEQFARQDKHHRWKLNAYQIKKYNLGGVLSITKNWWEGITIQDRKVNFFNLGEELSICSLICEDLARQDPISDLLRSVGPNLVFTLLMDGEQLKHRWSARYASILSDDPGSAVITLTSLGMVKRFSYNDSKNHRSIGIISDSKGNFTEINLKNDELAALVTLNLVPEHENLADRQNDFCYTHHLTLGALFPIKYKAIR